MNHTDIQETAENLSLKNVGKSPQELYDTSIRKGDQSIISQDIILAEKHYQNADHYLRLMNDPNLSERDPEMQPLASSRSREELIENALKGIMAERAARKAVFKEKAREAGEAAKAARAEKKDKAVKSKAVRQKRTAQATEIEKKPKNSHEPCKIIPFKPITSCVDAEKPN